MVTQLKKFYENFDKKKIPQELNETLKYFINSTSYDWSSKFWRRLTINHLKVISSKNFQNSQDDLGKEYFTFTYFNDSIIKDACRTIENNSIDLKTNIFKKQKNFSYEESLNHNIILYMLYENIKNKSVFKNFEKLKKYKQNFDQKKLIN